MAMIIQRSEPPKPLTDLLALLDTQTVDRTLYLMKRGQHPEDAYRQAKQEFAAIREPHEKYLADWYAAQVDTILMPIEEAIERGFYSES